MYPRHDSGEGSLAFRLGRGIRPHATRAVRKGVPAMRTLAEIKQALHGADREAYEAMARALAADERKGVKQALASTLRRLDAQDAERARLEGMYAFQREFCESGLVAGLDEVGRGPVAGPLTVAAAYCPTILGSKGSTIRSRYPLRSVSASRKRSRRSPLHGISSTLRRRS